MSSSHGAISGPLDAFDPYLVEWHRRSKRDRPSGTAADLTRRIVARHPRLGVADDLEVVSRDRSPYAAGILAAVDWLERTPRAPGLHAFDPIVDELIARHLIAA